MAKTNKVFPAYAGVILGGTIFYHSFSCFPRIRGGDPIFFLLSPVIWLFSPHTRG